VFAEAAFEAQQGDAQLCSIDVRSRVRPMHRQASGVHLSAGHGSGD
jgi:hypothetical protein